MAISRRTLLRRLAAGAAVTMAAPARAEDLTAGERGGIAPSAGAADPGRPIRLNRNANAYGPSGKAIAAMREAVTSTSRYPEVESEVLRRKIAGLHRVVPEQVILGCGCSEILRMAVDALWDLPRR